jgi:hypothetical protein
LRRSHLVPLATACCLALLAPSAFGESQTVSGKGDLRKMTAANGQDSVKVKLVGLRGPCDAKQFTIDIFWGTKPTYQVQAACTAGTTWTRGLYYDGDRRDGGWAEKRVSCGGFRLKYDAPEKAWRAVVPRSCIPKAPDRIRVESEGINYAGSAIPGEAGPTRLLRRG